MLSHKSPLTIIYIIIGFRSVQKKMLSYYVNEQIKNLRQLPLMFSRFYWNLKTN